MARVTDLLKTGAERSIQACLILTGAIHLAPSIGALGSNRLTALYGIPIDGPDLAILMRHRAVLFGILGALLIAGAVRASLRNAALLAGLTSVVSFLVLAITTGRYNARLGGIVAADVVALVLLLVAAVLQVSRPKSPPSSSSASSIATRLSQ